MIMKRCSTQRVVSGVVCFARSRFVSGKKRERVMVKKFYLLFVRASLDTF